MKDIPATQAVIKQAILVFMYTLGIAVATLVVSLPAFTVLQTPINIMRVPTLENPHIA